MVFAMGALYSLELPPNDPVASEYLALSKACLVKGNFLVNTTLSGVQTLVRSLSYLLQLTPQHIMAHFHLCVLKVCPLLTVERQKKGGMGTLHGHCGDSQCGLRRPWACIAMGRLGVCLQKSSRSGGECDLKCGTNRQSRLLGVEHCRHISSQQLLSTVSSPRLPFADALVLQFPPIMSTPSCRLRRALW